MYSSRNQSAVKSRLSKPNQTLPRIQLGVALLRVSTDKQFQEGESIENQRRKAEFVARRENIDLVRFFTEHFSGRKTDRRILEELFNFLEENSDVSHVIVGDIDRFTRGGTETYLSLKRRLRTLNVNLIDATGIIQPERNRLEHLGVEYQWSVESPSHYAEIFMAEKARAEASDILTRTIGQQIQLTREGYQCRGSNFGYSNLKIVTDGGKRKTIMVPNEEEAIWIRRMFELKADGTWRDDAICEAINNMGYRSRQNNIYDTATRKVVGKTKPKTLCPKQLNRYVSRTIYCGIKCETWNQDEPVRAPIEPLVSVELFNRANRGKVRIYEQDNGQIEIKEDRRCARSFRHNPEFLLRHVIRCKTCQRPLVASKSKGKSGKYFGYFHCDRGHARWSCSQSKFHETVGLFLDKLEAKPGFLPLFREVVRDVWMQKNQSWKSDQEQINAHINQLQQRQNTLIERIPDCSTALVQNRLEAQVEELEDAIKNAQKGLDTNGLKEDQIEAFFAHAKKLMEHPKKSVFEADTKERLEKIWSFIFANHPTLDDLVDGTPDLRLIYRLNDGFTGDGNLLAGQLSEEWNTFEKEIMEYLDLI